MDSHPWHKDKNVPGMGHPNKIFLLRIYPLWMYIACMAADTAPASPLSPAVFAILFSLAEGEKHGYQMMKDARSPEGGGVRLGPGTLYGSIDRMMRDGLVEESGKSDDERRRYYRLTRHEMCIRDRGKPRSVLS